MVPTVAGLAKISHLYRFRFDRREKQFVVQKKRQIVVSVHWISTMSFRLGIRILSRTSSPWTLIVDRHWGESN